MSVVGEPLLPPTRKQKKTNAFKYMEAGITDKINRELPQTLEFYKPTIIDIQPLELNVIVANSINEQD